MKRLILQFSCNIEKQHQSQFENQKKQQYLQRRRQSIEETETREQFKKKKKALQTAGTCKQSRQVFLIGGRVGNANFAQFFSHHKNLNLQIPSLSQLHLHLTSNIPSYKHWIISAGVLSQSQRNREDLQICLPLSLNVVIISLK